jgi:hypothetical protein
MPRHRAKRPVGAFTKSDAGMVAVVFNSGAAGEREWRD